MCIRCACMRAASKGLFSGPENAVARMATGPWCQQDPSERCCGQHALLQHARRRASASAACGPCTNGALSGTRLCSLSAHGGGPRRQLPAACGDPSSSPGAAGGTGPCRACRPTCGARRARTTSPMQRRGHAPRRRSADLITGLIRCRCAQASARPIGVGVRSMVRTSGDLLGRRA